MVTINAVGLGIPERSFTQEEIFRDLKLRRVFWDFFAAAGIKKRHLCYSPAEVVHTTAQEQHEHYFKSALELSLKAVRDCLEQAGLTPADIHMMTFSSCTGFTCPGMEHYIARELDMRDDMTLTAILGMGCGAAGPALRRVADYITLNPQHHALCVLAEVSNSAYHPSQDFGVNLGNSIFADGAAAILVSGAGPGLQLQDFVHLHNYAEADTVAMTWEDARLKLVLPSRTSELSTPMVGRVVQRLLDRHHLSVPDIGHFVIHSGGASILKDAQALLGVSEERLAESYYVWRNFGNMSSATAPFALHYLLKNGLRVRDRVVVLTLGAGFEGDGILAEYSDGGNRLEIRRARPIKEGNC